MAEVIVLVTLTPFLVKIRVQLINTTLKVSNVINSNCTDLSIRNTIDFFFLNKSD